MSLKLNYNGTPYVLEYNRKSVQRMEQNGFNIEKVSDAPMTMLPELFAGAFLANHKFVKRSLIDEIFDAVPNRMELMNKLAEMYAEPYATLMNNEVDEANQGKVTWEET